MQEMPPRRRSGGTSEYRASKRPEAINGMALVARLCYGDATRRLGGGTNPNT